MGLLPIIAPSASQAQLSPIELLTCPWVIDDVVASAVAEPVGTHHDQAASNGCGSGCGGESDAGPAPEKGQDPNDPNDTIYIFRRFYEDKIAHSLTLTARTTFGNFTTTEARMGFVAQTPKGLLLQPLLEATYAVAPRSEVLVPYLYHPTADMYIGIDLTSWVRNPTSFEIGDKISITDGNSPELPGFLVSQARVLFDDMGGWQSGSLFTGTAAVGGFYGVGTIPEPVTLLLLAFGALVPMLSGLKRRWLRCFGHRGALT